MGVMGRRIILAETEKQVATAIDKFGKKADFVVLSPFAMYELDKRGLDYSLIEEYYSRDDLYRLGIKNYRKVEKICNVVDDTIFQACPQIKELNITPAKFSFVDLKTLYDSTGIRLFQLSKLFSKNQDATFFYFGGIDRPVKDLYFVVEESVYSKLLSGLEWKADLRELPAVSEEIPKSVTKKSNLLEKVRQFPRVFDLIVISQKAGLWRPFKMSLNFLRGQKQILLFGQGLNWDLFREELSPQGINPIFHRFSEHIRFWISSNGRSTELNQAWEDLIHKKAFRKFFIWEGMDFFKIMEKHMEYLVKHVSLVCLNVFERIRQYIKRNDISAVVTSSLRSPTTRSAAIAAQKMGIPVLVWQHAIAGLTEHPIVFYSDFERNSIFLAWGEMVSKKLSKYAKMSGGEILPVGSSMLESLDRKLKKEAGKKETALFALAPLFQNNTFISTYPPRSDSLLWRVQRAIIDVLGKHEKWKAIIKLKPGGGRDPPARQYVEEMGFKNCIIIREECNFTDLLPTADVIILNSPSTTLLQSLLVSRPIFLYYGHVNIDRDALKLLKKRVLCYKDYRLLIRELSAFLSGDERVCKKIDTYNRDFLQAYGMATQKSTTKVAEIIRGLKSTPLED
jgi:hypothetical protein